LVTARDLAVMQNARNRGVNPVTNKKVITP